MEASEVERRRRTKIGMWVLEGTLFLIVGSSAAVGLITRSFAWGLVTYGAFALLLMLVIMVGALVWGAEALREALRSVRAFRRSTRGRA